MQTGRPYVAEQARDFPTLSGAKRLFALMNADGPNKRKGHGPS